ncbi:MAG: sulfatase-like hydrolase/transferase [Deltaproteobacteria bacterium]|jgi:phosphoglycerol transferase MdoB-like AlkP superfamily enzyme|nr:sulfatase-like hydrolase/transferase [Deltaproteobacteria bacterium]
MIRLFQVMAVGFRIRFLAYLAVFFLAANVGLRAVLAIVFDSALPVSWSLLFALAKGFANDCATLPFSLLAPATLVFAAPDRLLKTLGGKFVVILAVFTFAGFFAFDAVAEFYFWEEFGCRFNFIAVDYLVYTTELTRNVAESYPLRWLLAGVALTASAYAWLSWRGLSRRLLPDAAGWSVGSGGRSRPIRCLVRRLAPLGSLYLACALLFCFFAPLGGDRNRYWNEFAKNGVWELFSAYLNNQLDYRAFYLTMSRREAFAHMRNEIRDADGGFLAAGEDNLLRNAGPDRALWGPDGPESRPNVVIVLMESMGSTWLGELTPGLNELAENGLSFDRMMSTGTRTVRGIEAVMLGVPPTPGNSIVRRPDSGGLFGLGTMFRRRGYDLDFVYGGLGYFDNMNAFFESNGYAVTDKLGFSRENRTFANAWGQCDEDLYSESLMLADRSFLSGRPFHQVLLTTSNHRPFTFPERRIGMAQGTRASAVRYADYAASKYMRDARGRAWFEDTVFVFVGDHPASIAGKTEVPPDAYGIAAVMYGPRYFRPRRISTLVSQIDVAPTLLAALGWSYRSQFFGSDALRLSPAQGRAWISTYQLLGFRTDRRLVVLKPDRTAEVTRIGGSAASRSASAVPEAEESQARVPTARDPPIGGVTDDSEFPEAGSELREADSELREDESLVARAVASYQCAYDLFAEKLMKESAVDGHVPGSLRIRYRDGDPEAQVYDVRP